MHDLKKNGGCCAPSRSTTACCHHEQENGESIRKQTASTAGMRLIPGGSFLMGSQAEPPAHAVTVAPFYMDAICITNEQFNEFVNATGYKTEAIAAAQSARQIDATESICRTPTRQTVTMRLRRRRMADAALQTRKSR